MVLCSLFFFCSIFGSVTRPVYLVLWFYLQSKIFSLWPAGESSSSVFKCAVGYFCAKKTPTTLTSCCWQGFFFIIFYSAAALAWLIDFYHLSLSVLTHGKIIHGKVIKKKKQLSLYLAYFANASTFLYDFFVMVCRDHLFFIFYWAWINRTVLRGVRNCWGVWLENKCTSEGKAF